MGAVTDVFSSVSATLGGFLSDESFVSSVCVLCCLVSFGALVSSVSVPSCQFVFVSVSLFVVFVLPDTITRKLSFSYCISLGSSVVGKTPIVHPPIGIPYCWCLRSLQKTIFPNGAKI